MPVGSVQSVLVCSITGTVQAPCPAGQVMVVQAYVLDASQEAAYVASVAPFDYLQAVGLWTFAFSFVLGLYLVSKSSGVILQMVRRGW